MTTDNNKTRVVFLKDLDHEGEIVAVFPDLAWTYGDMTCYAHIGQHSACSRHWARGRNRVVATAGEIYELYHELTDIVGYNLEIVGKSAIPKAA